MPGSQEVPVVSEKIQATGKESGKRESKVGKKTVPVKRMEKVL